MIYNTSNMKEEEKIMAQAVKSSSEVRSMFRDQLVPMAFEIYKSLLGDSDPKVRKAAADSIMKIEGSLQNTPANAGSGGVSINLDFSKLQGMSEGFEKMAYSVVQEIEGEEK